MSRSGIRRGVAAGLGVVVGTGLLAACGDSESPEDAIQISGSATVAPISEAIATRGGFDVDIAAEGTSDGFERFCAGETAVQNASIAIPGQGQQTDFISMCADNGIDFVEIPIGLDSLTVVRNEENQFATDMTLDEVRKAWQPGSEVTTWSDIRSEWPDEEIEFFGRPDGSGTFEYFSHHVSGEVGELRDGYEATDDLDELAAWLAEEPNGLGFMGVGNYLGADGPDRDRITNVSIDGVAPTLENAQNRTYTPFTRPLFIYVNLEHAEADQGVADYVDHYVDEARHVLPTVFFYPGSDNDYAEASQRWESRTTGSAQGGNPFG